jgi:hypothetical protein
LNPANSNEYLYYDDLEDMEISESEIFFQGNDEYRKAYFGDRLEDIETFVDFHDEYHNFISTKEVNGSISLPENNPAYSFGHIGFNAEDEDDNIIVFDISNSNVLESDRPKGWEISKDDLVKLDKFCKNGNEINSDDLKYVDKNLFDLVQDKGIMESTVRDIVDDLDKLRELKSIYISNNNTEEKLSDTIINEPEEESVNLRQ